MQIIADQMNLPSPVVVFINGTVICCDPIPPMSGQIINEFDGYQMGEPGDLGDVYILLTRFVASRWVKLALGGAPQIQREIWDQLYEQGVL